MNNKPSITYLLSNYLGKSPRIQSILTEKLDHFCDLYGRFPNKEQNEIILKSTIITDYPALYEDTIIEAKEQGMEYPDEYATQLLTDITLADWESLTFVMDNLIAKKLRFIPLGKA